MSKHVGLRAVVALIGGIGVAGGARAAAADTLHYSVPGEAAAARLTLRAAGERIVIVDDDTGEIVASAPTVVTRAVRIAGAAGARNDVLTVDLSEPLALPGGIAYDGGDGGWDTLALAGGGVERETLTMLGPQEGIFDLDGLRLHFSNLEPIIDLVPVMSLLINATAGADTMVVEDGTVAANTRVRETVPNFESLEFSNKTTVTIDGLGGSDSIGGGDATPAAGLANLIIRGIETIPGMSLAIATLDIVSDTLAVTAAITGVPAVTIEPQTAATAISLGSEAGGSLSLTGAELDLVAATTLTIGNQTAGTIGVNASLTPAGITNLLLVTNGAVEDNSIGTDITVAGLGIDAETGVGVSGVFADLDTEVVILEARTASGGLSFTEASAVAIGPVAGNAFGLTVATSGDITLTASGTVSLGQAGGSETVHGGSISGNVAITATGAGSDIVCTVNQGAVTAPAGSAVLEAGRNILLGTAGASFDNDVRANGALTLSAGGGVQIDGSANVVSDAFGNDTGGALILTADGYVGVLSSTGTGATLGAGGSAGAPVTINAGVDGVLKLTARSASAAFSTSGPVTVNADHAIITDTSGITATSGTITVRPASSSWAIDPGSTSDTTAATLELWTAEVKRLFAPTVVIGDATNAGGIAVSATIITGATPHLELRGAGEFGGPGHLTVTNLTFTDGSAGGSAWTLTDASVLRGGGSAIPITTSRLEVNGGSGSDTFTVTPSAATSFAVDGNAPPPPASPGDTINVDSTGATGTLVTAAFSSSGWAGSYTFGNRNPVTFAELETLLPGPTADVSIAKSCPATVVAGGIITYSITVGNGGPSDAPSVSFSDPLPGATAFVSVDQISGPAFSCATPAVGSGGVVTCSIDPLTAGATADFTLTVEVPVATKNGTLLTNVASVASGASDTDGGNDASTVATQVEGVDIPLAGPAGLALLATLLAAAGVIALRAR